MRRKDREVKDRSLISGMLDMTKVMHIAIKNEPYPYVVPVNFGYEWEGDELIVYFHCAKQGLKLDLMRKDPHVAVNTAVFRSYAKAQYKGHFHDYRSVSAYGIAEEIDQDKERVLHAHELLMAHNHRKMQPVDYVDIGLVSTWQIRCRAEEVWGKAEIVPSCIEELPFA